MSQIHSSFTEEVITSDPVQTCLTKLLEVSSLGIKKDNGGTGSDNAFYGGVCKVGEGTVFKTYEYPCHANMRALSNPVAFYNRYTRRPSLTKEVHKKYLDWLLSEESPWRSFKNRLVTHLPEGVSPDETRDFILNHGWVWTDFSAPSNLQHSFLVASRMPAEWPKLITKWGVWTGGDLRDEPIDKALAFVFLDMFRPLKHARNSKNKQLSLKHARNIKNKQLWQVNSTNMYDWPLDATLATDEYVYNFMKGRVENLNPPFSETSRYTPVNRIFGKTRHHDQDVPIGGTYPFILYRLYNGENGTVARFGLNKDDGEKYWKGKLGWSQYSHSANWVVTEDEIIQMIRLEQRRLNDLPNK